MAGSLARFTVPSDRITSPEMFEVSGTCFTITMLLHFIVVPGFVPVQGFVVSPGFFARPLTGREPLESNDARNSLTLTNCLVKRQRQAALMP
jgi:hypothetical protein